MYALTFKVRELLIFVLLMLIDLFIDWGNSSNNLSDYIKRFRESQSFSSEVCTQIIAKCNEVFIM